MAANKGYDGAILIGTDAMAHITSWEVAFACDALEKTNFGSTLDREFVPGLRNHSVTFTGYSEDTDTAQYVLTDLMTDTGTAPAAVTAVLLHNNTTGSKAGYTGSAVLSGLTHGAPVEGLQTFGGTLQVTNGLSTYSS